jgi:hypothetical protein
MELVRLMYVSTSNGELGDAELDAILASSVRHNTEQDVTGMLLYCGGNFMQVLEGWRAAVEETYARLSQDPRHRGLILLGTDPIGVRDFASWRMGFRRVGAADAGADPAFAPIRNGRFDVPALQARPGTALQLLRSFAALLR